jgi:hypothetical protein
MERDEKILNNQWRRANKLRFSGFGDEDDMSVGGT